MDAKKIMLFDKETIKEKMSGIKVADSLRQGIRFAIMWRKIVFFFLVGFILLNNVCIYGQEYKKIEIKYGMHEKVINRKYGEPILTEKLKSGFPFVPNKKSLYRVDESTYMILKFFAGRISTITIVGDITLKEVSLMFKSNK